MVRLTILVPLLLFASLPVGAAYADGATSLRVVQLFATPPTQNPAEAVKVLRRNAEQGDPNAQYTLALAYDVGVGAQQDFTEAAAWYYKAAEQGHAAAQFNLGLLYASGRGVPQDFIQAHMWFNLAAAGGEAAARKERDELAKKMTRSQIAEAVRLAREWQPK
jgi:TPR repeat protein